MDVCALISYLPIELRLHIYDYFVVNRTKVYKANLHTELLLCNDYHRDYYESEIMFKRDFNTDQPDSILDSLIDDYASSMSLIPREVKNFVADTAYFATL